MTEQRRHFSRIPFSGNAVLYCDGRGYPCALRDLSLKGALLELSEAQIALQTPCSLGLHLGDDVVVRMRGHVAHVENECVGIACENIDLDSITHLRRLLELNLGDPALLERELAAMISD